MLGAAVLLEGCGIPWVGFPSEICSAVPCLARNVELSFPVFLFVGCRDKLRSHQQPAWAPTHPTGSVCPQSLARELELGVWAVLGALLLLSHFTHPCRLLQLTEPHSGTGESSGCCLCAGEPHPLGG